MIKTDKVIYLVGEDMDQAEVIDFIFGKTLLCKTMDDLKKFEESVVEKVEAGEWTLPIKILLDGEAREQYLHHLKAARLNASAN